MNYKIVSKDDISEILDNAYNPPVFSDTFTENDFQDEYWSVHEKLKSQLTLLGRTDDFENYDNDFTMNEDFMESRGISVELNSIKLWNMTFVKMLSLFLSSLENNYSIYVDHDLLDYDDFSLIFQRGILLGSSSDLNLLKKFGFK